MTASVLGVADRDGARWLTLDRPRRLNALDRELADALLAAVVDAAADPAVRTIVLTGAGGAFCAGDDIHTLTDFMRTRSVETVACHPATKDATYLRVAEALVAARKPVVAAIDGVAAGAGIELACAADLRIASTRARIGSGLVRAGQVGTFALTSRVVGPSRATELYLSGRLLGAEEALAIGLVSEVLPEEEFAAGVERRVAELSGAATAAIGMFKELRERSAGQPVEHAIRLQDRLHVESHDLHDSAEGFAAFTEGRAPRFAGR